MYLILSVFSLPKLYIIFSKFMFDSQIEEQLDYSFDSNAPFYCNGELAASRVKLHFIEIDVI